MPERTPAHLAHILFLTVAAPLCFAQQPAAREEHETVKVYTDEVRLPIVAYDDRERRRADVCAPHGAATLYAAGRRRRAAESNE